MKIIKILILGIVMPYMAFIQPMGQRIAAKASQAALKALKRLNQETTQKAFFSLSGKRATEKLGQKMIEQAKKGFDPLTEDLALLDSYCQENGHGVLNFADEHGHTLLYYIFRNNPRLSGYKGIFKQLSVRGACLNIRDKYVMGSEKILKTYLNLPLEANAVTTIKVLRTFLTKNKPEKIEKRVISGKMPGKEAESRLKKVEEVNNTYKEIESALLEKRELERVELKKEKYFKFSQL